MIFDSRNAKAINRFIDYEPGFGQVSRRLGLSSSDDGTHVVIKNNGQEFVRISREEYQRINADHKSALLSSSAYAWNNYAIYGWLHEKGLIQQFMQHTTI